MSFDPYEDGYARIHWIDSYQNVPIGEYDRLRKQWRSVRKRERDADPFFVSRDLFGCDLEIDLSEVHQVSRATPESLARHEDYEEAERLKEKAKKLIDGDA